MTRTEIQHALERLGRRPLRSLGQNFLHDMNMARWIVARLGISAGDHVVEIGPGLGALTELLVREDIHLTLLEKDEHMVQWLRERFASARVELFHIDALDFDLRSLYGTGPAKSDRQSALLCVDAADREIHLGPLSRINTCSDPATGSR